MATKTFYQRLAAGAKNLFSGKGKEKRVVTSEEKLAMYRLTNYRDLGSYSFNGEKNPGNAGPLIDWKPDHYALVIRSWQAMTESAPARIAVKRRVRWLVGKGLRLQSEPVMSILGDAGIKLDKDKFTKAVEDRWNLWAKSKRVDYSGKRNLHQMSRTMETNGLVGGDVLIVLRVVKGELKVQLIDGAHVQSPEYGSDWWPHELENGHIIVDGVEMNAQREHVAYWVKSYSLEARIKNIFDFKFTRVAAYGEKSGYRLAYMYSGDEFRIDTTRGFPVMSPFVEKINSLELYSTAALKQAQGAAKIDYQSVTEKGALGGTPWAQSAASAQNGEGPVDNSSNPVTDDGVEKQGTINITGIGTAIENPPGTKIEMLKNENPLYFNDFHSTHRNEIFAGLEIPPDVAMMQYNNSYSASRTATKDNEHTLVCGRQNLSDDGLQPIFDIWIDLEILNGRIQAPGYMMARAENDQTILEAYRNMRLVGPNVPHIDPVKEATAARIKLGEAGKHIPLGDAERLTESLSEGDWNENKEQFVKDVNWLAENGVTLAPPAAEGEPAKSKKKPD